MNNEHPGGGECRSPSPPRALRALPPGFPLLLFRPLHGAGPGPGARGASPRSATRPGCCPPLRSRATNAVCSRVAIRFAVAALARRSAALRRPRRSVGAALGFASRALALPLRPPRVAPPAAGPPLAPPARLSVPLAFRSAALAAVAGAGGRRSSTPGGLNPRALGGLALLARLFPLRARGPPAWCAYRGGGHDRPQPGWRATARVGANAPVYKASRCSGRAS